MGSGRKGDGYVSLGCLCLACLSHGLKTCRDAWVAYGSFGDSQSCDFIKLEVIMWQRHSIVTKSELIFCSRGLLGWFSLKFSDYGTLVTCYWFRLFG